MTARCLTVAGFFFLAAGPALPGADGPAVVSHIPRQEIQSSAIKAIGYSKRRHIFEVQFNNGSTYRYLDVTPDVYRALLAAESKARYYDRNIRGHYRSLRVRARANDQPPT